jgi:hypothetical protein
MARDSVFYKLANDENSFTELLCNLLMRKDFRAQVLPRIVPGLLPSSLASAEIATQKSLTCGRPDIVIRTSEICVFIEVKLNPRRGFTHHQELSGCDDPDIETYVRHLEGLTVRHKLLLFLLPADSIFRVELEEQIRDSSRKIEIEICFWEDILDAVQTNKDPIVEEFKTALRRQLGLTNLSQEEKEMITSVEFPSAFRAVRKLEKLVDEVVKAKESAAIRSEPGKTEEEYGVYFKAGNKFLLWFGLWDVNGRINLCYAISHEWGASALAAIRKVFRPEDLQEVGTDVKWIMYGIPDQILTADITVAAAQIKPQLRALLGELLGSRAA